MKEQIEMKTNLLNFKVCAHRGASSTHPENTLAAFDEAARLGAHMIEFDVRRTADGRFVIMHDAKVDRTTNGTGEICNLTFEEIRSLDAGDGQKVPTLDEATGYAKHLILNIHAYPQVDGDSEAIADALMSEFRKNDMYDQAFVASTDAPLLHRLRTTEKRIRLCPLLREKYPDYVARAMKLSPCEVLQPFNDLVTPELVQEAHGHGLKVNPYFADDEDEMRRLIDCGVDGLLTNCPEKLLHLLETLK